MTRYLLITVATECLLVYTIYKTKNYPLTKLNRFFIYFYSVVGLFLILLNLGLQIHGLDFHRNMTGLTVNLIFFGLLFIHQSNRESPILKDTPLTIVTIVLVILFFISFISGIRDITPDI